MSDATTKAAPPVRRTKLLFVCARNKIRSLTAERMLAGDSRYAARSRGVAREARVRLTEADLRWADLVFVMEKEHKKRIAERFAEALGGRRVHCLFIEDIYEPMEPALIAILRERLRPWLEPQAGEVAKPGDPASEGA